VIFSVSEDELDVTVNDRRAPVCLAMAAFADASTELVVSARADGRADGVNPQQAKVTSAVVASLRGRPKRQALDLWTKPTPTNLTVARGLEPVGHKEQTQPVACCAAQSPPDGIRQKGAVNSDPPLAQLLRCSVATRNRHQGRGRVVEESSARMQ
jgi:hypothetical protein